MVRDAAWPPRHDGDAVDDSHVTGGLAYGEIETNGTLSGYSAGGLATSTGFSHSEINFGWTVGAGLEGRIGGNWTGKIEYLYVDFGSVSGSVSGLAATPTFSTAASCSSDITDHIQRVGLNYKFTPAAIASRY